MVRFVLAALATLGVGCAMAAQAAWPDGALGLVAGLAIFGAGADLALRRAQLAAGALLAGSGLALQLGGVPLPDAGSAALFTAALAGGAFAPALAGAAAVCAPVAGR